MHDMFQRQFELQLDSFHCDPQDLEGDARASWMCQMLFGAVDEIHEAAEHVGWKAHGTSRHFDTQAFGSELVDVLHYVIALFIAAGWTADDVMAGFMAKADVIAARQASGHNGRRVRE